MSQNRSISPAFRNPVRPAIRFHNESPVSLIFKTGYDSQKEFVDLTRVNQ